MYIYLSKSTNYPPAIKYGDLKSTTKDNFYWACLHTKAIVHFHL